MMALANPKILLLLLIMAALLFGAYQLVLAPIVNAALDGLPHPGPDVTYTQTDYLMDPATPADWLTSGYQDILTTAAAGPILVRTAHASLWHGENIHNCFQDPRGLFFLQEQGSGRVHVVCAQDQKNFFDLIVKDRRPDSGYVEEVTAFQVDQYESIDDFISDLLHRVRFACDMIAQPDWLPDPIKFLFK